MQLNSEKKKKEERKQTSLNPVGELSGLFFPKEYNIQMANSYLKSA